MNNNLYSNLNRRQDHESHNIAINRSHKINVSIMNNKVYSNPNRRQDHESHNIAINKSPEIIDKHNELQYKHNESQINVTIMNQHIAIKRRPQINTNIISI